MQEIDPYQTPTSERTNEAADDPTVKLWLPQASMMAEQGKTAMSIQLFFKSKDVEERLLASAVQLALEKGQKGKRKGARPYQIAGWTLIALPAIWLTYLLIIHQAFSFLPLFPIAIGYGLLNGSYLRDKK